MPAMTPIKRIITDGQWVSVEDMAGNVEDKAMCGTPEDAHWLADSLARAHGCQLLVLKPRAEEVAIMAVLVKRLGGDVTVTHEDICKVAPNSISREDDKEGFVRLRIIE